MMASIYKVQFIPCEGDISLGISIREEYYVSLVLAKELGEAFKQHKEGRSYQIYQYALCDETIITS